MPESFPVFVNLSIIVAFAVTARDDEIFSNVACLWELVE